jgi:sensor domain CHASE-containing protein
MTRMKLRIKTLVVFVGTTICLICSLHVISEGIILGNFSQLEQSEVSKVVGQVQIAFTNDLNQFQNKADDWAKNMISTRL